MIFIIFNSLRLIKWYKIQSAKHQRKTIKKMLKYQMSNVENVKGIIIFWKLQKDQIKFFKLINLKPTFSTAFKALSINIS